MARFSQPFAAGDVLVPRSKLQEWPRWAMEVHEALLDGSLRLFPIGGGQIQAWMPETIAKYDLVKVPQNKLDHPPIYSAEFVAEWLDDKAYKGWSTGERWNGWAIPMLELEEAKRYAIDSQESSTTGASIQPTRYDPKKDAFLTPYSEDAGDGEDEAAAFEIEVPGRGKLKVYSPGGMSWTWSEKPLDVTLQGRRHFAF